LSDVSNGAAIVFRCLRARKSAFADLRPCAEVGYRGDMAGRDLPAISASRLGLLLAILPR